MINNGKLHKCIIFAALLIGLVFGFSAGETRAQSSAEIIENMEEVMRGESSHSEMNMRIERPRYTRDISMETWSLGDDYSMILITAPSRDEGITYLQRGNEMWNYQPSINRTIKMPPSMMSQSWMGSDFTNEDLVRESSIINEYEHRVLREEEYNGYDTWVLELIPNPETPVVWGKVLIWVAKDGYMQLRVENYDQRDELANTIELSEIEEVDGRKFPTRMVLTPEDNPNQRTIITYENIEFNVGLEESFFTQQNMRRVR